MDHGQPVQASQRAVMPEFVLAGAARGWNFHSQS